MPPLTTLAPKSTIEKASNDYPILSSELVHFQDQKLVFLVTPLAAKGNLVSDLGISNLFFLLCRHLLFLGTIFDNEPAFEASDFCFIWHKFAKAMPAILPVDLHKAFEFVILQKIQLI